MAKTIQGKLWDADQERWISPGENACLDRIVAVEVFDKVRDDRQLQRIRGTRKAFFKMLKRYAAQHDGEPRYTVQGLSSEGVIVFDNLGIGGRLRTFSSRRR